MATITNFLASKLKKKKGLKEAIEKFSIAVGAIETVLGEASINDEEDLLGYIKLIKQDVVKGKMDPIKAMGEISESIKGLQLNPHEMSEIIGELGSELPGVMSPN